MGNETIFRDLQRDVAGRLAADPYFIDINILTEYKTDLLTEITNSLGAMTAKDSKVGTCVLIMQLIGNNEFPDIPGAVMGMEIQIRVLEDVLINTGATGTGKDALTTCRHIIRQLHLYQPFGISTVIVAQKPTMIPVQDPIAPLAYECRFYTREATTGSFKKTATPVIKPKGGTTPLSVEIECGSIDPALAIYYTTDGSHPSAVNSAAILYSGPFTQATAATVRAVAYVPGQIDSDCWMSVYQ